MIKIQGKNYQQKKFRRILSKEQKSDLPILSIWKNNCKVTLYYRVNDAMIEAFYKHLVLKI